MAESALVVAVALYLVGALSAAITDRRPVISNFLSGGFAASAGIAGLLGAVSVFAGGKPVVIRLPAMLPFTELALRIDSLSAFFILIISILAVPVSIFAWGYSRHFYGRRSVGLLGSLYNLFLLSMFLVVASNNAFLFLLLWEMMAIVSYLLVVYEHDDPAVRRAGLIYIVMTHLGAAFLVTGFFALYSATGSFDFDVWRAAVPALPILTRSLVFGSVLIGLGTKAGIIPVHIWLPQAHPAAPSHVSALMSGVMLKTAIYALLRVVFDFLGSGPAWWGLLILGLGAVSAVLGIIYALMERDFKRLLAMSSVENIGIILMGAGAGVTFFTYGRPELATLAVAAALFHALNHASFKGLLFLGAGAIHSATHTKNLDELGGLIKRMPLTAVFLLIGSAAISALPPLNGFFSEWLTFQSLLRFGLDLDVPALRLLGPVLAAALALTGGLAAACFVKAYGAGFLALPRSEQARHAREVHWSMIAGMGILASLSVALGALSGRVVPFLIGVAGTLTGSDLAWARSVGLSLPQTAGNDAALAPVAILIAIGTLAPLAFILPRLVGSRTPPKFSETWTCGITLEPRMEYTATSFSKPLRMVFAPILGARREIEREHDVSPYFPRSITYRGQITPVFEQYLYGPVRFLVITISNRLRRLQGGSVQVYLGYIFVSLIILLAFAQ